MKRLFSRYECNDRSKPVHTLRGWYEQPLGSRLRETECELLAEILPNLFGYHLLQVGNFMGRELFTDSRISHCMVLDELQTGDSGRAERFYGCATDLPMATDSLDVVLLPHVLEFASDPHQVLREIDRVLIPEGHVIILGFNPYSMWGLRRMLTGWRKQPPWCSHFFSLYRIKDWLSLLGFEMVRSQHYFFRPPVQHHATIERLLLLETMGEKYWPLLGGAYLVVAKKRVTTLTPIRPSWKPNGRLVPGSVTEPTLREID